MTKIITGNESPDELVQYDKKILQTKNYIEFLGESVVNNQSGNSLSLRDFVINVDGDVNKSTITIKPEENISISSDNICMFIRDSKIVKLEKIEPTQEVFNAQHFVFTSGDIKITNNNIINVVIDFLLYKVK